MAKADLGEKRVCAECEAKFFDLKKRPVVCPKCGFSFDPDAATKKTVKKPDPVPEPKETKNEEADEEADEDETEATDDDEQELSLDGEAPLMGSGDDDENSDSDTAKSSTLPDGYTEEGVEDDSEILSDDEDEDAKLVDEEELNSED